MKIIKTILLTALLFQIVLVKAQTNFDQFYPDTLIKKRLVSVGVTEMASYAAGLSFLSFIWYKDSERAPFHFYKDGKGYLQIDKAGHAFSAYKESAAAYNALRWAGVSKKKALIYGGPVGLLFQTPIVYMPTGDFLGEIWWQMPQVLLYLLPKKHFSIGN